MFVYGAIVSIDELGDPRDCFASQLDAALLADIVAHPYQLPTLEELAYTNQRHGRDAVEDHLESLVRRDLVERVSFSDSRPRPDEPDLFFGLTELGRTVFFRRMPDANASLLQEAYASVDKPPEIEAAERAPRPARTRE